MSQITNVCPLCHKGFTQHAACITCSTCHLPLHPRCLPLYLAEDIIYASDPTTRWSCPECLKLFFPFSMIEDDSDIRPLMHDMLPPNLDSIGSLLFDPFDTDLDGGTLDDLDPDLNFYNTQAHNLATSCKFYQIDELNKQVSNLASPPNIAAMHLNIRSLKKNCSDLNTLLHSLDHPLSSSVSLRPGSNLIMLLCTTLTTFPTSTSPVRTKLVVVSPYLLIAKSTIS